MDHDAETEDRRMSNIKKRKSNSFLKKNDRKIPMNDSVHDMNTPLCNLFGKHQDPAIPASTRDVIPVEDMVFSSGTFPITTELDELAALLHERDQLLRERNRLLNELDRLHAEKIVLKKILEASERETQKHLDSNRQNSSPH